jgi:hypothetical protein
MRTAARCEISPYRFISTDYISNNNVIAQRAILE